MEIDKDKMDAMVTSKLCNVMVNCQELVDDLEDLQEEGLFKQNLKQQVNRTLKLCETQVNNVFGGRYKKMQEEISRLKKKNVSKKHIEEYRKKCIELSQMRNKVILEIYELARKSRIDYQDLEFHERLLVLRLLEDIRNGTIEYSGDDLKYTIEEKQSEDGKSEK